MSLHRARQLFVDHQARFRQREADLPIIEREWQRKGTNQKRLMGEALQRLRNTEQAVRDHVHEHPQMRERVRGIMTRIDDDGRDLPALNDMMRAVLEPYRTLHDLISEIHGAWLALEAIERSQKRSANRDSIAYAEKWIRLRGRQVADTGARIARFEEELDAARTQSQSVPVNTAGRVVVPEQWVGDVDSVAVLTACRAHRDDLEEQHLRAFGEPRYMWTPWMRFGNLENDATEGWLWICFDASGNKVVDRVYRKTCSMSEGGWADARRFDGDVKDPQSKVPWELACHDALMDAPDLQHVVSLRQRLRDGGSLVDERHMSYRLYMDYCPHGDLQSLIRAYKARNERIPEPLIWCVAEALVNCAAAMRQGTVDEEYSSEGWRPIIHRDIKPHNVFLDKPSLEDWPAYPTPLLADFGHAFRKSQDDPNNPRWFNHSAGTVGYLAPEQIRLISRKEARAVDTGRLSSRTNVYGIGATLYCLFTLEDHPEQPLWLGGQPSSHKLNEMQLTLDAAESDGEGDGKSENDDEEAHTVERQNSEDQESDTKADDCDFLPTNFREEEPEDPFQQKRDKHVRSYSVELRRLIMWCLRENPAARRSVDALQRYISGLVSDRDYDSDDSDFDQSKKILRDVSGMRTGLAEDEVAARRALEYQQDRYKTGMSREDLPRRSRASVQDGDDCKLRSEA